MQRGDCSCRVFIRVLTERTNVQAVCVCREERLGAPNIVRPGLYDIVQIGGIVAVAVQEAEDARL